MTDDIMLTQATLVFEKWKASLEKKPKNKAARPANFDELFSELHRDGVDFKIAHDILAKAIKAHMPLPAIVKITYKKLKTNPTFCKTEAELIEEWKKSVEADGTESFYAFYSIPKASSGKGDPEDVGPKVFGNMSEREYRLQRRMASSFPVLDTTELERKLAEQRAKNLEKKDG